MKVIDHPHVTNVLLEWDVTSLGAARVFVVQTDLTLEPDGYQHDAEAVRDLVECVTNAARAAQDKNTIYRIESVGRFDETAFGQDA